jgi:hypothetical protein
VTGLDLDAIEARANDATEGPWHCRYVHEADYDVCIRGGLDHVTILAGTEPTDPDDVLLYGQNGATHEDGKFIAHAREDVPALLQRVRELERQVIGKDRHIDGLIDERDRLIRQLETYENEQ